MARIKYSGLVTEIKGSIGGTTFQSSAYGYTIKNKPNMVKPQGKSQRLRQQYMSLAVRAWEPQRLTWVAFATKFPQYSKNNRSSQLTGYNLFCKIHFFRFMAGQPLIPIPTSIWYGPDNLELSVTCDGHNLALVGTFDMNNSEYFVLISISSPTKATKKYIGTNTRYLYTFTSADFSEDMTSQYLALFGALPAENDILQISVQYIGKFNGQFLTPNKYTLVVLH
jgi:hypothetical protein